MKSNVWMLWNRAMSAAILCPVVCVSNITNKAAVCGKRIKSLRFLRERKGCSSGGIYVPCIYTHARWALLQVTWSLLLYLHYLFWWLINSLVCWFYPFLLFISTEQTNMAGPWGAQIQSPPPPPKKGGGSVVFWCISSTTKWSLQMNCSHMFLCFQANLHLHICSPSWFVLPKVIEDPLIFSLSQLTRTLPFSFLPSKFMHLLEAKWCMSWLLVIW